MDFNNSHSRRNFVRQLSAVGAAALSTESIRHGAETADTLSNERQVDTPRFVHPTLTRHARGWLRLSGSKQSSNSSYTVRRPTRWRHRTDWNRHERYLEFATSFLTQCTKRRPDIFRSQSTCAITVAGNQNNADQ